MQNKNKRKKERKKTERKKERKKERPNRTETFMIVTYLRRLTLTTAIQ